MHKTNKYLATCAVGLIALSLLLAVIPNANAANTYNMSVTLSNSAAGATSSYTVNFTTATLGSPLATVEIDFPTSMLSNTSAASLTSASGIGAGTAVITGFALVYTVATPVDVPAGTNMSFVIANVGNLGTAGTYTISVTTKTNGFGTPIIDTGNVQFVITGAGVIPEFSSPTMLVLVTMMASAIALALGKKYKPIRKVTLGR